MIRKLPLSLFILVSIPAFAQDFRHIKTSNEATPRHENGFVAAGDKLYLIGGRGMKPVEVFDPQTNQWNKLSETPLEMHHFQPVAYQGKIYVIGALTGKFPHETPIPNVLIFDPEKDEWHTGASIPENRRRGGAACAVSGSKAYITGGIIDGHSSGTVNWLDAYDFETEAWEMLPDAPRKRDHVTSVIAEDHLYILGGRQTDYHEEGNFAAFFKTNQAAVDRYDIKRQYWTTLGARLPVPTAGGGAAFLNGKIYYTGGETVQEKAHHEVQVFSLDSQTWEVAGSLQTGRHGTCLAVLGNHIYIASGSENRGGGPELSSIEYLELK